MTVNELIARLQELVAEGHGECEIVVDHSHLEEVTYNESFDRVEG